MRLTVDFQNSASAKAVSHPTPNTSFDPTEHYRTVFKTIFNADSQNFVWIKGIGRQPVTFGLTNSTWMLSVMCAPQVVINIWAWSLVQWRKHSSH